MVRGKNIEFRTSRNFEHNSTPNYTTVKKFRMRRQDLNAKKKQFRRFWSFRFYGAFKEETLNFRQFEFSNITRFQITPL